MKLCRAFSIFFLCMLAGGLVPAKGQIVDNSGHSNNGLPGILTATLANTDRSTRLLGALLSERIPVAVARAMLARHINTAGSNSYLRPFLQGFHNREDLALSLVMFHQMGKTIGNTIVEKLEETMDDRTYSFLVDVVCNCSFYYQDEHDHKVKGFFVDLLDEVCREAGKKCVVQQQPYRQCYVSGTDEGVQPAGVGILSRQFDGCVVSKTSGIANSMSFTDKFQDIKGQSRFFVPVGNPENFNPDDISGKTIGFINGWYSDPRCLLENKLKGTETLKREQMRFFDHGQLWSNLQNNVIDAAFVLLMPENGVDDKDAGMLGGTETGLEPIGDVINCLDGLQVGARKDSDMVDWFNGALRKLKQSGKFAKLCRKAQIDHGARGPVIDCIF